MTKSSDEDALLGYLERLVSDRRKARFREVLQERTRYLTVVLEDVYHLHNTSAVMRSCDAFGVQELHLIEERFGKRIDSKIARGAQQWVELHRYPDFDHCFSALRRRGFRLAALVPGPAAIPLQTLEPDRPTALIFGSEKEGLSPGVIEQADHCVHIPMCGFTESLNVSVSVGIVLRELTVALKRSGVDWRLSEEDKESVYRDWIRKSIRRVETVEKNFHLRRDE